MKKIVLSLSIILCLFGFSLNTVKAVDVPPNLFNDIDIINTYSTYWIGLTNEIEKSSVDEFSVYIPISSYIEFENAGNESKVIFYDDDGTVKDEILLSSVTYSLGGWLNFNETSYSYDYIKVQIAFNFDSIPSGFYSYMVQNFWISEQSPLFVADKTDAFNDGYEKGFNDGKNDKEMEIESIFGILTDTDDNGFDDKSFTAGINYAIDQNDFDVDWIQNIKVFFGLFNVIFDIELIPGLSLGILLGIVLIPPLALKVYGWLT